MRLPLSWLRASNALEPSGVLIMEFLAFPAVFLIRFRSWPRRNLLSKVRERTFLFTVSIVLLANFERNSDMLYENVFSGFRFVKSDDKFSTKNSPDAQFVTIKKL